VIQERSSGRFVWTVAAILAGVALYLCYCGTPLIWDGAYQFAITVIQRWPYYYNDRFHSFIVWLPVVWAERVTRNHNVLEFIYGLPFCMAPVVGLLVSWWVVREYAPGLIIWAIFGVAAAALPGQIFIINDSIFQQHLFWPVFLGAMVPLTWPKRIVLGVLVAFQFSHQIGIVLLAGAAVAAAVAAMRDREMRNELLIRFALLMALAGAAIWKAHHWPDSYAEREFTWLALWQRWAMGVAGCPIAGLCFMWLAAAVLFVDAHFVRFDPPRTKRRFTAVVLACAAAAGVIWVYWACHPHLWWKALDYRRWLVPLTMPFFTMAFFEGVLRADQHGREPAALSKVRGWLGLLLAVIFAAVLLIQSHEFTAMGDRLMADVEKYPGAVVPYDDAPWMTETCFDHWGSSAYVMVRQGMRPTKWLIDPQAVNGLRAYPGMIPLCWFTFISPEPGPCGWYDLRKVHENLLEYKAAYEKTKGSGTK
jgi:hypothetical protein